MKRIIFTAYLITFMLFSCEKPHEFPWEFSENPSGCIDFVVYVLTEDHEAALEIIAVRDDLGLSTSTKEFDLRQDTPNLDVGVNVFSEAATAYYCSEDPGPAIVEHYYPAMDGFIRFTLSSDTSAAYTVSIELEDVTFSLENESYTLGDFVIDEVAVGWSAPN